MSEFVIGGIVFCGVFLVSLFLVGAGYAVGRAESEIIQEKE
jgi:hypothetical protein